MYHVIRSSKQNLEALEVYLNNIDPRFMIRPKMTVFRRTRKSRRMKPHTILMYPGYAFVKPEAIPYLRECGSRWTHHFLNSPTAPRALSVPDEQLEYALQLQFRSLIPSDPITKGTRVHVGERSGTVQESQGYYAIVWFDDSEFPAKILLCDIRTLPPHIPDFKHVNTEYVSMFAGDGTMVAGGVV